MTEKPCVFVSYSHKDRRFVDELVSYLEREGYDVWYDEKLPLARVWKEGLRKAIKRCGVFLAVVTPNSVESEWCRWELYQAALAHQWIVPVWVEPVSAPPIELKEIQGINCVAMERKQCVENIAKKLKRALMVQAEWQTQSRIQTGDVLKIPVGAPGSWVSNRWEGGEPQVGRISEQYGLAGMVIALIVLAIVAVVYVGDGKDQPSDPLVNKRTDTYTPVPTAIPSQTSTPAPTRILPSATPTDKPYVVSPAVWEASPTRVIVPTATRFATLEPSLTKTLSLTPSVVPSPTYTPFPTETPQSSAVSVGEVCSLEREVGIHVQPLRGAYAFATLGPNVCMRALWQYTNSYGNRWAYVPDAALPPRYVGGWIELGDVTDVFPKTPLPSVIVDERIPDTLAPCHLLARSASIMLHTAPDGIHGTNYKSCRVNGAVLPVLRTGYDGSGNIWYFTACRRDAEWVWGWVFGGDVVIQDGQCPAPQ